MARNREQPPLVLLPLPGGWVHVTWRGEVEALVRFEPEDPERYTLRLVELRMTEPWLERMRELSVSRIAHAAHADADVRFELFQFMHEENDDPALAAAMKKSIQRGMTRHRLERPAKRRLDDAFFDSVARAYADAVAWGLNPRKTLATDSDTPADTVARWIREARKRGKLSTAEQGKASGSFLAAGGHGKAGAAGSGSAEKVVSG